MGWDLLPLTLPLLVLQIESLQAQLAALQAEAAGSKKRARELEESLGSKEQVGQGRGGAGCRLPFTRIQSKHQ